MIPKQELRALMIKNPRLKLWDKNLKDWTISDYAKIEKLKSNKILPKRKMKRVAANAIKVIRISDGYVYDSIVECQEMNGFHKLEMIAKLKLGTEFKKNKS